VVGKHAAVWWLFRNCGAMVGERAVWWLFGDSGAVVGERAVWS
jgi:hypothetical protein